MFRLSKRKIKKLLAGVDAYLSEHYVPEDADFCETASLIQDVTFAASAAPIENKRDSYPGPDDEMAIFKYPVADVSHFQELPVEDDEEDSYGLFEVDEETSYDADILSDYRIPHKKPGQPAESGISKKTGRLSEPEISKRIDRTGESGILRKPGHPSESAISKKSGRPAESWISRKTEQPVEARLSKKIVAPGDSRLFGKTPQADNMVAPAVSQPLKSEHSAEKTARSLDDLMRNIGQTWQESLFRLIDEKGFSDMEVYKRANIDRKLFSKIRSNPDYQPKKNTAVALAIALKLTLDEVKDFLSRAGYALSPSSRSDLIIEYFVEQEVYDLYTINLALFEHDQPLLE